MKRIIYLFVAICATLATEAQTIESVKTMLTLQQYTKAKEELDKGMGNAKFNSKPEAYMLKCCVYAALAMDNANKSSATGEQLAADAEAAFKKYKEMDAAQALLNDPIYQNGPVNLYSYNYSKGYNDYTTKNWNGGYERLKKAVEYSDLLIAKKLLTVTLDTNVLILAGITAENSKHSDDAAKYYGRLADVKIPGPEFESIYRYLVNYYFGKKDMESFEKYKAMGAELYPKSEYFTFDKVDFAVGLVEGFDDKVKEVETVLAKDPDNFKANQVLGEIIYDTLNSTREGAVLPSNAAELETKMINAFKKSAAAKPNSEIPYLYMGDHFINKAVKINDARASHAAETKARTKPGTMASKDDIAKRDKLDLDYGNALEQARVPYEKAAEIFAAKGHLEMRDKQQYKKACNYLADIFAFKKVQSKGKPADLAKYTAEEKKWNDVYDNISANPSTSDKTSTTGEIIKMQEQPGGTYKVPCEMNGVKLNFIFDSGASDVSISLTEAQFMLKNGHMKIEDIIDIEKYRIANGQLEEGFVINIRELKIGNYILTNIKGSIVKSTNAPLLLGMTAIKKLGFKFDPSKGTLFK